MTMNDVPDRPKPINTPAEKSSIGPLDEYDISARPTAYISPPAPEHPTRAETVGDDAGSRLADAPKQIL